MRLPLPLAYDIVVTRSEVISTHILEFTVRYTGRLKQNCDTKLLHFCFVTQFPIISSKLLSYILKIKVNMVILKTKNGSNYDLYSALTASLALSSFKSLATSIQNSAAKINVKQNIAGLNWGQP